MYRRQPIPERTEYGALEGDEVPQYLKTKSLLSAGRPPRTAKGRLEQAKARCCTEGKKGFGKSMGVVKHVGGRGLDNERPLLVEGYFVNKLYD